jgi:carbon monoxide dehydrogenase subunit G
MNITGADTVPFPVSMVWDALLDPAVLVATIPGCSRLVETSTHTYDMTVTAGVAAIRGTYNGTCRLTDLVQHESLVMHLSGAGAPGMIDAKVSVTFTEPEPGVTTIGYDADATVGGAVGGVGQRMLVSVSRRMAGEFFGNVTAVLAGTAGREVAGQRGVSRPKAMEAAPPRIFERPAAAPVGTDFAKGVAVGAGLVILGAIVGAALGRRR